MASNNTLAKCTAVYEAWKLLEQSLTGQLTYYNVALSQYGQVIVLFSYRNVCMLKTMHVMQKCTQQQYPWRWCALYRIIIMNMVHFPYQSCWSHEKPVIVRVGHMIAISATLSYSDESNSECCLLAIEAKMSCCFQYSDFIFVA